MVEELNKVDLRIPDEIHVVFDLIQQFCTEVKPKIDQQALQIQPWLDSLIQMDSDSIIDEQMYQAEVTKANQFLMDLQTTFDVFVE